jgi:polyisoprenoid-binding protein YceI
MPRWTFEPGHTAAEFKVRHMMVSSVRGHFKNVHGTLRFDPNHPRDSSMEVEINAGELWTGDAQRDAHLKNADFLDVARYPTITFRGNQVAVIGANDFTVTGDLTLRGVTRPVSLRVRYLGQWKTPWWEDGVDKGPKIRAGFEAETTINRHDFGVSWQSSVHDDGIVVGDEVQISIDVEAIQDDAPA